jgi:hypothetical protein
VDGRAREGPGGIESPAQVFILFSRETPVVTDGQDGIRIDVRDSNVRTEEFGVMTSATGETPVWSGVENH